MQYGIYSFGSVLGNALASVVADPSSVDTGRHDAPAEQGPGG